MILCPKCNKELVDGASFCDACGARVFPSVFCTNCGAKVSTEFPFCHNCGAPVAAAPAESYFHPAEAVSTAPAPVSADTEEAAAAVKAEEAEALVPAEAAEVSEVPVAPEAAEAPTAPEAAPVSAANPASPAYGAPPAYPYTPYNAAPVPPAPKKKPKLALLIAGIGVVAIAIIITAVTLLLSILGVGKNNYALYIKDHEMYYNDLGRNSDSMQVSTRLVDDEYISDDDLLDVSYALGMYAFTSEDGSLLFYPDKINSDDEGFNLYCRNIKNPFQEPVKIDSGIQFYTISADGNIVTYLKGYECNLYQYDLKKEAKEKLGSEVDEFYTTEDAKTVIYLNSEGNLYQVKKGEDKEKLASEIQMINYVSKDLKTVYYTKDDSLYMLAAGKDKVKIGSDIFEVLAIYESGEVYFVKSETEEVALMEYVYDDMLELDASLTEPEMPKEPYSWNYDTYEEYEEAYYAFEDAYVAYQAVYEAYLQKQDRDYLRSSLEGEVFEKTTYSLHYYDGSEATVLTNDYARTSATAADKAVIVYKANDDAQISKVKLSECTSYYDITDMVYSARNADAKAYVAMAGTSVPMEQEQAMSLRINKSGNTIYFVDNVPEGKDYGDLYQVTVKNGTISQPELYDSDVYYGYSYFTSDDDFLYFKDYNNSTAELYVNQEMIDFDVYVYSVRYHEDQDAFFYFADWNPQKNYGTLKIFDGREVTRINEEVHSFTLTHAGQVLYLYDYSLNYFSGDLHLWANGKDTKLDDDVVCFIPIIKNQYRGGSFNTIW